MSQEQVISVLKESGKDWVRTEELVKKIPSISVYSIRMNIKKLKKHKQIEVRYVKKNTYEYRMIR